MSATRFIAATAGHVDHGKSALVKALTGVDPDRLPEEKARGITIELGFGHLPLGEFEVGIIDVPGHEDFVKNMVAGVGAVDAALFVVAADDGWMPQTEEHLQILLYQGVTHAVVALTKFDLAVDEVASIAGVREKLRGTPFADATIVPTSIVTGRGFEELKAALAEELRRTPHPRDIGKPRLPVDRAFTMRGVGTVVTGTLSGGELRRGQAVVLQPAGLKARVRGVQTHSREVESSGPGTRTALNLSDVTLADAGHPGVARGQVITLEEFGGPATQLDVLLARSPRCEGAPLKNGARVRLHHGSGNVAARVTFAGGAALASGASAVARLRLEEASYGFVGDRFILRDWPEQLTLAGGIVLDTVAKGRFSAAAQQRFLARRSSATMTAELLVESQIEHEGAVRRAALLVNSNFSAMELSAAVTQLMQTARLIEAGEQLVWAESWKTLRSTAAALIDAWHKSHPEQAGLPLNDLRADILRQLPAPEIFDALVRDLCTAEFAQSGTTIARRAHRPALPPQLQAAGARIRAALAVNAFDPPPRRELAPDALSQQALRFLRESGEIVELPDDVILLSMSLKRIKGVIGRFIEQHGPATVSDLRQAVGTTRRVMMPVLERLDREGYTVRTGDRRALRVPKAAG